MEQIAKNSDGEIVYVQLHPENSFISYKLVEEMLDEKTMLKYYDKVYQVDWKIKMVGFALYDFNVMLKQWCIENVSRENKNDFY